MTWNDILHRAKNGNPAPVNRVEKTDAEWRAQLSPAQYQITRQAGTERPFSSEACAVFATGSYHCICCDEGLFDAETKYDSGSGWPAFTQPVDAASIKYVLDKTHGMDRVEVRCNCCDAHLGHVFPDGPQPSGLRYCINALALRKKDPR